MLIEEVPAWLPDGAVDALESVAESLDADRVEALLASTAAARAIGVRLLAAARRLGEQRARDLLADQSGSVRRAAAAALMPDGGRR